MLTEAARRKYKSNKLTIAEEAAEDAEGDKENVEEDLGRGKRGGNLVMLDKARNKETNEEKRREHQKELMESINRAAQLRLSKQNLGDDDTKASFPLLPFLPFLFTLSLLQVKKSSQSYKSHSQIPNEPEVKAMQIYVGA